MHSLIPGSVQRAKIVLTDSLVTRQEVIDEFHLNPNHVCAVPLGVDDDYYPRGAEELEPILMAYGLHPDGYSLFVSTIEPRKNILNLLAAYRALPVSVRKTWPLVLAGGVGWQSHEIHAEIERATGEGWLKYLGFVSQADLPFLYAGCRLFTYPSWYEGFGLPIAEAMASGVPVLTSNCSSMPEVAAGCAMLVEPGDVADMTQKVRQALEDTMWRKQAIQLGLQRAAQLTWDACVKNTVTAYHLADAMR
jgi:alpha-1,3-rhamnosyl/mannosyltransferase